MVYDTNRRYYVFGGCLFLPEFIFSRWTDAISCHSKRNETIMRKKDKWNDGWPEFMLFFSMSLHKSGLYQQRTPITFRSPQVNSHNQYYGCKSGSLA